MEIVMEMHRKYKFVQLDFWYSCWLASWGLELLCAIHSGEHLFLVFLAIWNLLKGYPVNLLIRCEGEDNVKWGFINALKERTSEKQLFHTTHFSTKC
ncbi:uncharacterized protein LOC131014396 isoform X2 [Salvia miltiorrhiza]|uniref:uncharacterized protein LOC131014396 isoform X2 n=1 Tax=Salvia miltiorrhiza TaxID=226208 RepID=UPI0025AC302F|nr:uncharacterized protein LOC131014396 isoform X2 [Salvia miltiorrhiza]